MGGGLWGRRGLKHPHFLKAVAIVLAVAILSCSILAGGRGLGGIGVLGSFGGHLDRFLRVAVLILLSVYKACWCIIIRSK